MFTRLTQAGVLLVLSLGLALPVQADDEAKAEENKAPLWVIDGDVPTYLFGTIHVPDKRVLKVPALVDQAIDASDVHVGEIPLDLASQMKAQSFVMLKAGETLQKIVGDDLYARVKLLVPKSMPEMVYRQFSPWAVISMIELGAYMEEALKGRPALDQALYRRFMAAKKKTDALETIDDQINVMKSFAREEQVQILAATVAKAERDAKAEISSMESLLRSYLAGNLSALMKSIEEPITSDGSIDAKFRKVMVADRNAKMADALDKKLKAEPGVVRFVALGAAHFPGEKGILKLLEHKGYKVRRLQAGEPLPKRRELVTTGK